MTMDFGAALKALKAGKPVYRDGWNGKGMWLLIVPGDQWLIGPSVLISLHEQQIQMQTGGHAPFIAIKTTKDDFIPWTASNADLLAEDWRIV